MCRIDDPQRGSAAQQLGLLPADTAETLVLYTYSNSDLEYERNLQYFVEHGMAEGDGCDYIIVVQEVSDIHLASCEGYCLADTFSAFKQMIFMPTDKCMLTKLLIFAG